jgi:hypothetical protein
MLVVTLSHLAQYELDPVAAPTPVQTPAPAKEASSSSKPMKDTSSKPKSAPEKPLSLADKAAAATRARMAEIMGPRRPQGPASGSKYQAKNNWNRNKVEDGKKPGGGAY